MKTIGNREFREALGSLKEIADQNYAGSVQEAMNQLLTMYLGSIRNERHQVEITSMNICRLAKLVMNDTINKRGDDAVSFVDVDVMKDLHGLCRCLLKLVDVDVYNSLFPLAEYFELQPYAMRYSDEEIFTSSGDLDYFRARFRPHDPHCHFLEGDDCTCGRGMRKLYDSIRQFEKEENNG